MVDTLGFFFFDVFMVAVVKVGSIKQYVQK